MANWLDLTFNRGDMSVLGAYPTHWSYDDGGYPALYPEFVYAKNVYVSSDRMQIYDATTSRKIVQTWANLAVGTYPWGRGEESYVPANWSPNAQRDRIFIEASIIFSQSYFDGLVAGWSEPTIIGSGWDWGSWGYIWLEVYPNTDADWNNAPGTDLFVVETFRVDEHEPYNYGDSEYHVAGAFSHAALFDGNPHIIRLEWRGATLLTDAAYYLAHTGSKGYLAAEDGEIKVAIDGMTTLDVSNVKFLLDNGGWTWGEPESFAVIGKYQFVWIEPLAGQYVYVKAGPVPPWIDIANYHDVVVSYWQFKYGQARVLVDLWTSDGSVVKARLWNSTDGVSVGESVEISSTTPVETEFAVALTMGVKAYRLQVLTSEGEVDYFCVGQLMKTAGA